jgi:hypothetical protein
MHLTTALSKSGDINYRRCWCDGVLMPGKEENYSPQTVKNTGQIITKAWIDEGRLKGKTMGQHLYTLVIHFGSVSLKRYMDGNDLKDCLPTVEKDDWIRLDVEQKQVEIQLL